MTDPTKTMYPTDMQSPAPSLAELLRDVEPHVEWMIYIESHNLYFFPEWQFTILLDREPDKVEQALLLGAICAECDARGWYSLVEYLPDMKKWRADTATHRAWSEFSRCHAALLAFLDAVRASIVCPECNGQRHIGSPPDGYEQCPLCNPEQYQIDNGQHERAKQEHRASGVVRGVDVETGASWTDDDEHDFIERFGAFDDARPGVE